MYPPSLRLPCGNQRPAGEYLVGWFSQRTKPSSSSGISQPPLMTREGRRKGLYWWYIDDILMIFPYSRHMFHSIHYMSHVFLIFFHIDFHASRSSMGPWASSKVTGFLKWLGPAWMIAMPLQLGRQRWICGEWTNSAVAVGPNINLSYIYIHIHTYIYIYIYILYYIYICVYIYLGKL